MIQIHLNDFPPIIIASTYVAPTNPGGYPVEDIDSILKSGPNVILAGDLNAFHSSWNFGRSNRNGFSLNKFLKSQRGLKVVAPPPDLLDLILLATARGMSLIMAFLNLFLLTVM
ncbi:hypothetical protein CDAR_511211 [Caerostris darwini]|uniref:Endonuclease/exonuclease/phosphatase domain-containing protein n=1 Tax=Caerostris darwini TaxID=1538125 RepID=A0AAV4S5P3_9ARAC|nr:hypothetical protein CDAR_511211 [Caerostris darwini]